MKKNRESAHRSRIRRKEYIQNLETETSNLRKLLAQAQQDTLNLKNQLLQSEQKNVSLLENCQTLQVEVENLHLENVTLAQNVLTFSPELQINTECVQVNDVPKYATLEDISLQMELLATLLMNCFGPLFLILFTMKDFPNTFTNSPVSFPRSRKGTNHLSESFFNALVFTTPDWRVVTNNVIYFPP